MDRPGLWLKSLIHGDEEYKQHHLIGALKNYLWVRRYGINGIKILHQHNRDIYYFIDGLCKIENLDVTHLDEVERKIIKEVPIEHITSRIIEIPTWWDRYN